LRGGWAAPRSRPFELLVADGGREDALLRHRQALRLERTAEPELAAERDLPELLRGAREQARRGVLVDQDEAGAEAARGLLHRLPLLQVGNLVHAGQRDEAGDFSARVE